MAKLIGDWAPNVRRSFKGASYIYRRNGQTIMAAMPTASKKQKSEKQLAAMDLMRRRSLAIKAMPPELVIASSFYARGNALMPRDYLFMSMAGRHTSVYQPPEYIDGLYARDGIDGAANATPPLFDAPYPPTYDDLQRMYPMAALDDLSFLLDIYGNAPGTLIVRRPEGWRGLEPGVPGQVLGIDSEARVNWGAGGGGGGGLAIASATDVGNHTNSVATKGNVMLPAIDVNIHGVQCTGTFVVGHRLQATAALLTGNTITTVVKKSDIFIVPNPQPGFLYVPFSDPATLPAGSRAFLCLTDLDLAPTGNLQMRQGSRPMINFPQAGQNSTGYVASNNPDVGTVLDPNIATWVMAVWPAWST